MECVQHRRQRVHAAIDDQPGGDIAEDKIATTAGTYRASATLSSTSGWVMQAVDFRAG
jgi:hypothetical protein